VAVIGYDDREIAQFTRPPLTTILLPHFEMGTLAAEYVINNSMQVKGRQLQIKVECPLVERNSVGPILPTQVD
jgi:LacI family transcriptional regulator